MWPQVGWGDCGSCFFTFTFNLLQLLKLPNESIQHPTPLIKLIITWSKIPRYKKYLVIHIIFSLKIFPFFRYRNFLCRAVPENLLVNSSQEENISLGGPSEFPPGARTILHYVYQCLFSPGVRECVTGLILEMTLDLLDDSGSEVHHFLEVLFYTYISLMRKPL